MWEHYDHSDFVHMCENAINSQFWDIHAFNNVFFSICNINVHDFAIVMAFVVGVAVFLGKTGA